MFQEIYRFELKYNLKRIAPYVFFAVLGLMAYMDASNVSPTRTMINTHGQIDHNSPITIARTFLFLSILGSIIPIVFAGTSVVRDFEKNVHEFFFSKPVSKLGFLTGRFFGGFTVVIFVFLGVVLGIAVGCLQIDSQYVGAFRLEGFLQPFLMFAVPNLLLMAVVFFAFATLTRNMIATYIAGIASIVIYLFAQSTLGDTENQALRSLLDPFGFVALEVTTEFWTVAERNTQLLPFKGFILWNRLLWLAVTVGIFVFLYFKFRFVYQKEGRCTKQATEATDIEFKGIRRLEKLPSVARTFAWKNHVKQLVRLVKLECLRIVPHPAFLFLTFLGMMQAYGNFVENAGPNGSNVYPLTSWYLNWTSELFGYMIPITVFFAGVVVWREGDSRSEEIFDAMPVPDWVLFLSKLLTMMAIQTVFILAVMATGIFAQGVIFGYTKFELPLYFKALFGIQLLNYWHMAIVAILIQALVSHKYVGYFLSGGYFIADYVVYSTFNVTNFLHRFGLVPDYVYSNMNGFGHYAEPIIWYRIYWAFAAVILIVVSDLLWRRGQETKLKFRLRAGKQRLSRKHVLIAAVAACAFVSTGSFIYYNIHVLNPYLTQEDRLQNRANYEKRYGKYAHIAQPSIDHISFDVDIFPQKRDALIKGSYLLKNAGDTAIDSLHVRLSPLRISRMNQLALEHPAQLVHGDEQLGYYIFELAHPLTPGDSARLAFDLEARTKGFTDITPNDELVENGTYLDNFPFSEPYYFPAVGYSIFYEIRDPSLRAEYGLPKKQIPPPLEDSVARNQAAADWVTFEAVVSTSDDQIAVATGDLVESWSENGRNYYRYMVDKLMNNALVFLSGRYEVERDKHKDVDIEVFYHKEHHYNIERMIQGVRASLDYCSHNFASYPYNTVKIVEVPDYGIIGGSARSQPTVFTWTENGGFISNLEDEDAIDVVFNTTTHEMAHQWWGHMVKAANVEGLGVLTETMAQWVRVMCMQKMAEPEKVRRFLREEMHRYLIWRARQVVDEPPLLQATSQAYLNYSKGTVVMYALQDYIGEETVNLALRRLAEKYGFQGAPYPTTRDLVRELRAVTPDSLQFVITDLFETITLYENKALEANAAKLPNGKFEVELKVGSRKFRADGKGNETEIDILDYIDIGLFDENGEVLYLGKHRIDRNQMTFKIVVGNKPSEAGIDPYVKLIDKKRENNRTAVSSLHDDSQTLSQR